MTPEQKIDALVALSTDLNRIKDLDVLMERILSSARAFSGADAGSIYMLKEDGRLHFTYTQNSTLEKRLPENEKLIYGFFSIPVDRSTIAGFAALTKEVVNIDDAYHISASAPYSFGREFDQSAGYRTQSILSLPLVSSEGAVLGVLQLINAMGEQSGVVTFDAESERQMKLFSGLASVALERALMTRSIIMRMVKMAELRDPRETGAHVNRVASIAVELYERWARNRGVSEATIEVEKDVLRIAAMLHDVGKVAISDVILKKPAKLTQEEFEVMKTHTEEGARLFIGHQSGFDRAAQEVSLNHHEKWDGTGYPGMLDEVSGLRRPLRGEEIPLFGRIVAIADVYDALLSKRVYKEAWTEEDALQVIREESGKQFDPEFVDVFFSILDIVRVLQERYPDE